MHVLGDLEQQQLICSGSPQGSTHTYALFEERVPSARRLDRDEALAQLAIRYVAGHGPATVRDLAYWAMLTPSDAEERPGVGGRHTRDVRARRAHVCRDLPDEEPPVGPAEPRAHLLQILDEMYRGFQDSRMVIDAAGAVPRGREASIGMVLHDGQLVASMKRSITPQAVVFRVVPRSSWTTRACCVTWSGRRWSTPTFWG